MSRDFESLWETARNVRPVLQPTAPYYVTLSRAHQRPVVDVWPIQLWERLPVLPVSLLEPDPDVPLDLGTVVAVVYERGAYTRLIDYSFPPPPPALSAAQATWLEEHLRAQKVRSFPSASRQLLTAVAPRSRRSNRGQSSRTTAWAVGRAIPPL